MKKWIYSMLLSCAMVVHAQQLSDQQLVGMLDLTRTDMKVVAQYAAQGNYAAAVQVWRDTSVNRLRRMSFGQYGWHSDRLNGKFMRWSEFLVMDPAMTASVYYSNSPPYYDYYGMRGAAGSTPAINWLGTPTGTMKDNGGGLSTFIMMNALAAKYWSSGNVVYLNKYLDVVRDFSTRQKGMIESLSVSARTAYTPDWTQNAQETLDQGTRVKNIIRSLALFSKNLPGETKIASWNNVLDDLRTNASSSLTSKMNANWMGNIVAGLVRDNPSILLTRYQYAGAVPNQRLNGITSILFIGSAFPEFKACASFMPQASVALDDYLSTMMYPDGAMLEQSFNYNDGDAGELNGMNDIFNTGKVSIPATVKTKIDLAVANYRRMTWALRTPHMVVPLVGNVGHSKAPQLWKDATTASSYVSTKSAQGTSDVLTQQICNAYKGQTTGVPAFTSLSFPYAGYYTQRNGWKWNSQYLFFNAARAARGHKMSDNNGIQIVAYGRDMLVTDGPPDYFGTLPGPVSKAMNEGSSLKVNTVMVDGNSQTKSPILVSAANTTIATPFCNTPNLDFVEGNYNQGYGAIGSTTAAISDVSHNRKVIYLKGAGLWLVSDLMKNTGTVSRTYRQTWNFAPWLPTGSTYGYTTDQVVVDASEKKIYTNDATGPNILLQHVGTMPMKSYKSYYGDAASGLGYYATGISAATPAKDVHAEWTTTGNSALGTIIQPSSGLVSSIVLTDASDAKKINVSFKASNGDDIRFVSGFEVSTQSHLGFTISAKTLVLVKQSNGVIIGMVNGTTSTTFQYNTHTLSPGWTDFTFEFNPTANSIVCKKMETPDMFQWTSTPAPKTVSNPALPYVYTLGCTAAAPLVTSTINYKVGQTASALTATGTSLKWYATAATTTFSTLAPVPSTLVAGTTEYFVSQTVNGCESPKSKISVVVSASNQAPVVAITSPTASSSFVAPANITIAANASDADGSITRVEFYAGTSLVGSDATSPYSLNWTNLAAGTYSVMAKAYDNSGSSSNSAIVTFQVKVPTVNIPPTVSLTAPSNNSSYNAPATVVISANALDSDGSISKVEFYSGTTLLSTDITSPYSYSWSNVAQGVYSISVRAYDNSGASAISTPVSITVKTVVSTVGINGPACVTAGQSSVFTKSPEFANATTFSMWSNSGATFVQDAIDKKKFTVFFPTYLSGTSITLIGGINYSSSPYYKEYSKSVKVGGCTARTAQEGEEDWTESTSIENLVIFPNPSTTGKFRIAAENSSEILQKVNVYDHHGVLTWTSNEVQFNQEIELELNGLYWVEVITNKGVKRMEWAVSK